jgi:hypothetical protein
LSWDVILIINSLYGTDRFAGSAINAFIRLYIEHSCAVINAINRALLATRLIFDVHARFGDYICHESSSNGLKR